VNVPVAFAFAAGLVATINPCGFAMLPAYLGYFLGLAGPRQGESVEVHVGRGLAVGAVVAAGFLTVFGIAGALVSAGLRSIIDVVPWVALVVGLLLVVLGAAMLLFGVQPTFRLPHLERSASTRGFGSVYLFGVSYGVASLSCALPIFLTVVTAATATPSLASGVLTFVVYGAGMSMLLVAVTIALAVGNVGMVRWLRRLGPYIGRMSGAILVVAGGYITFYWATNLRDPLAARNSTARFLERWQTWLTDQLGTRPVLWAIILAAVIAGAVGVATHGRRAGGRQDLGQSLGQGDGDDIEPAHATALTRVGRSDAPTGGGQKLG
jgi:cytochrome c-type biogenesis protein